VPVSFGAAGRSCHNVTPRSTSCNCASFWLSGAATLFSNRYFGLLRGLAFSVGRLATKGSPASMITGLTCATQRVAKSPSIHSEMKEARTFSFGTLLRKLYCRDLVMPLAPEAR
jgi:hypothetical protein